MPKKLWYKWCKLVWKSDNTDIKTYQHNHKNFHNKKNLNDHVRHNEENIMYKNSTHKNVFKVNESIY